MRQQVGVWLMVVGAMILAAYALGRRATRDADASRERFPPASKAATFAQGVDLNGFLRGNVHTHTWMSDGDSSPGEVIRWYVDHGYDFVAITDHNRRADVARFREGLPPDFVLVPGEEVTMVGKEKPVHVNALCHTSTIGEGNFATRSEALAWAVGRIHEQGGVALVNHPNFLYALEADDIAAVGGVTLLDIFNGHPMTNSAGNADHASAEQIWQRLLDAGRLIPPAAVDDAHAFTPLPPEGVPNSRPGTGWIGVAAGERSADGICRAIAAGRLYASNGPRIARIQVVDSVMSVWVAEPDARVEFIGRFGAVLESTVPIRDGDAWLVRYALRGDELFVRAKVAIGAASAWTAAFPVAPAD